MAVEDDDPTAGCNQVTACLCGLLLRAERVGNMPVLYARRRPGKPSQLICLVGPFWPCLMGVTYPLILGVSLFSAIFLLPDAPTWAVVLWAICTCTLVVALTLTACTNPGIVRRHRDEPPANTVSDIYASSDCILSLSLSPSLLSLYLMPFQFARLFYGHMPSTPALRRNRTVRLAMERPGTNLPTAKK